MFFGVRTVVLTSELHEFWHLSDEILKCDHSNGSYWAVLSCGAVLWVKSLSVTIQMKAIEQYFPMVLFIMLYKVVLTIDSVDRIRKCDHLNESYWAILYCGAVWLFCSTRWFYLWVCGWNSKVWPFKWKLPSSAFLWCCLLCCTGKLVLTFKSVDEICGH